MDDGGLAEHRHRVLAGLSDRVLEVGAGNGANFPHYPREVIEVVGVEPEPYLRARARERVAESDLLIKVVDGVAERLEFADGSFDAAVATLVLCTVDDQHRALRELHRVLRPGGELRFFEHVRSELAAMRVVQRVLDTTVWPLVFGGDHTGRDTRAAIEAAGFKITQVDEVRFPDVRMNTPVSRHLLGIAVRP